MLITYVCLFDKVIESGRYSDCSISESHREMTNTFTEYSTFNFVHSLINFGCGIFVLPSIWYMHLHFNYWKIGIFFSIFHFIKYGKS